MSSVAGSRFMNITMSSFAAAVLVAVLSLLVGLCGLAGCAKTNPPQFRTNIQDFAIAIKAVDPTPSKPGYFQGMVLVIRATTPPQSEAQRTRATRKFPSEAAA